MADAAVKGTIYSICSMPRLLERNFCDGLNMAFTSPLGGVKQAGSQKQLRKAVIVVSLSVSGYKRI